MSRFQRRCVYCHKSYTPDPRTRHCQKACIRKSCQRKRKTEANAKFARDNPTYFQGRYGTLKKWLAKHPGYLARYRLTHPEHREKNRLREQKRRQMTRRRVDIQAAIPRRQIADLRRLQGVDIQDTIQLRLDGLLGLLATPSPVDIQVSNAITSDSG